MLTAAPVRCLLSIVENRTVFIFHRSSDWQFISKLPMVIQVFQPDAQDAWVAPFVL
jgi:hypothetical protein